MFILQAYMNSYFMYSLDIIWTQNIIRFLYKIVFNHVLFLKIKYKILYNNIYG